MLIRLITNYIFFRLRLSRFFYFYHKTHEGWLDTLSSTSSTLASPTSPTVHIHTSAAFNRYWWAHAKVQNFFCYLATHYKIMLFKFVVTPLGESEVKRFSATNPNHAFLEGCTYCSCAICFCWSQRLPVLQFPLLALRPCWMQKQ